jgi:hypothetical protein
MTVSDLLEQPCKTLIISTMLLQPLTSCTVFVDNLGQAVRTQFVDGLSPDLLQDMRFLRVCFIFTLREALK